MTTDSQIVEKRPQEERSVKKIGRTPKKDQPVGIRWSTHAVDRRPSNGSNGYPSDFPPDGNKVDAHQANGYAAIPSPPSFAAHQSMHGMRVSEEEYWAYYYDLPDVSYEWNNGILEEKPLPDFVRITMYGWLQLLLHCYLDVNPVAKMLFLEMGFRLPMEDKTTARKPDLFIILNDNPVPLLDTDRSYRGTCNMCVESVSDSTKGEVERDTITKKAEYERVGVQEYFILDPGSEMAFYRLDATGHYQPIQPDADGVIHSEVLPGFRFRIRDLIRIPSLDLMAEDPVYQPFVMLKYQAEKQRAELEKQRAELEKRRAEIAEEQARAEKARAESAEAQLDSDKKEIERYKALLRQLGIELPSVQ